MGRFVSSRLDRYMFRQLSVALVAVTLGLVALIWLTQSLRLVELVVNRGLSLVVFLQLTGLLIPNFVAVILPITVFVVVQFVYQRLAGDRELTVMSAAGLSSFALARPALLLTGLVVAACYVLNLWLVPLSYTSFREYQFEIRSRVAAFLLQEGVFTPISDELTVYIRSRDQNGTLRGILVEDARQKNSRATILAESGKLVEGRDGPQVILHNGSRQQIDHETGRLNVLTFKENSIDLASTNKNGEQRYRDAGEMSTTELLSPPASMPALDRSKLKVEAHRRLSTPLSAVSFSLVALLAVLSGQFRRHGNLLRPMVAVMSVVGLVALGLAIGNLATRQLALVPLIYLQAVLPGVICAWRLFSPGTRLVRRLRLRRPRFRAA